MSAQELEKRKGCNRNVVTFFIIAVACIAAFLIIGLVKTCKADHEDKKIEEQVEQEALGYTSPAEEIQIFA